MIQHHKSARFIALFLTVSLAIVLLAAPAHAVITVDGYLDDWGVSVHPTTDVLEFSGGLSNNVTNGSISFMGGTMYYHSEDQNDGAGQGGYLGPNYGGQEYDAEFMGVTISGNTLYVAISTGQRQKNGFGDYAPGDLQIETYFTSGSNTQLFGVEIGGGEGGWPYTDTIVKNDPGSTYQLNGNGHTTGHTAHPNSGTDPQTAGSVWLTDTANGDWINDPIHPKEIAQINGGTRQGVADSYIYRQTNDIKPHAFIEMAIPLDLLKVGGETPEVYTLRWNPSCGNDELEVEIPQPDTEPVPEPTSFAVWGLLLATVGGWKSSRSLQRREG